MQPTILSHVTPGNPAFRDEFFGPVAMFFRVADDEAAIALANDSDFGLGGSVFTNDLARGKRVASRVDTGILLTPVVAALALSSSSASVVADASATGRLSVAAPAGR